MIMKLYKILKLIPRLKKTPFPKFKVIIIIRFIALIKIVIFMKGNGKMIKLQGMAHIILKMVLFIKVNGTQTCLTGKEFYN
jgi:hypothetical protein